ncbi:MAG: class I SAM-dependent RNA methyltransferase [Deltaproteobacteria bacterium]|jgi:23S rRNA (uracil1939-C5)-methyltransferase|nr:class I SAM-dependent RNA methyltransferase [Deltaproteobacteria bacterium]
MTNSEYLSCSYSSVCSGCSFLHLSKNEVHELRILNLRELGISVPAEHEWIATGRLRDRLEFTLEIDGSGQQRLGLYSKTNREIVDLEGCPQLSEDLEAWLQEFRRDLPPTKRRAAIRLRVSPSGLRGVWIDAANEDLRDLLEESKWFERQLEAGIVVEAGQKRKRVALRESATSTSEDSKRKVGLIDAVTEAWFETSANPPIKVFGSVGTFTQPGFKAGKKLVSTVQSHLEQVATEKTHRITELGCGSGTFTLALLKLGYQIQAFEFDLSAITALEKGYTAAGFEGKKDSRLQVFRGDFIQSAKAFDEARKRDSEQATELSEGQRKDVLLVDPPRTGLGSFLDRILSLENYKGAPWVYVSCFPESFAKDLQLLQRHGYKLGRLSIVEQFPFTKHYEIVATIELF